VTDYRGVAAVLFDLDGTLIEHTRDIRDLCLETFNTFAESLTPLSQERFWETFWLKNHDLWYMTVDGMLTGDVARIYSFINTLRALKADEQLAEPMLQDWEGRIIAATRLFDDTLSTIGRLRTADMCLGIVTNGFKTMQNRKIHHHGLAAEVEFVLISEEAGVFKPEKALFDMALDRAGVSARQALFVGDTPSTDIEGAQSSDLHAVLMDPRDTWSEFESDQVPKIRCLCELIDLLGLG
jgi:putative hydrolase of the HAD superfamily